MENTEVIMLRLYNGDYIIGEYSNDTNNVDENVITDNDVIHLKNPREFVFMPSIGGSVSAGFRPLCLFDTSSKERVAIRKDQIMITVKNVEVPKEIENGYRSNISGISIASPTDIPNIDGSNNESGNSIII